MDELIAKGYTPLWYIESDGTQYIDTGFKPNQDTRVVVDVRLKQLDNAANSGSPFIFGTQSSSSAKCDAYWYRGVEKFGTYYGNSEHQFDNVVDGLQRVTIDWNKNNHSLNGETYTYTSQTFSCAYNLILFGCNYMGTPGYFALMRLYSCQIYNNGTLIRDYVPAKNSEGVCGLYDKVNDVFYSSATDSGFTGVVMGSNGLPLGYTKCEYIESDGTNYIDTGFAPNQNTRVEMDVYVPLQSSYPVAMFGGRNGDTSSSHSFNLWAISSTSFRTDFNSNNVSANISTVGRFVIDKDKTTTIINGVSYSNTASTFQSNYNLALFSQIDPGGVDTRMTKMKLYSCKIYDNGTLIRDYIPCQTDNGVYGLWDDVNKEFVAEVKQEAVAPTYTWSTVQGTTSSTSYQSAVDGVRRNIYGDGDGSVSRARCTFKGVTSITFNCMYSGENNYDYLTIGNLDSNCTRDTYGTSLKGTSGTPKDITFACSKDEHFVEFCYSKDGSVTNGDDCGYVYIKSVVAVTAAASSPFTGKWAENKEMKFSLAEWRHRLMVSSFRQKYYPQGVYIQDKENNLYAVDDFPTLMDGLSVVVVDNACKPFGIIPPDDTSDYIYGSSQTAVIGPYRTVYETSEKALLDYNGKENTQSILDYAEQGGVFELAANSAVYLATMYYVTDGENTFRSYMPSVGQCALMQKYIEEINKGFSKLGFSVSLEDLGEVWTSTCAGRNYGATETWYDNYVWKFNYNQLVSVDMYQNYNNAKYGYLSVIDIKL